MQVKIKLGQLFTKDNTYIFVSIILFIGCTAFVAFRGYRCFDKYLKKPKNLEVSFESSKNHPFPSFTLCASENASYNDDLMRECPNVSTTPVTAMGCRQCLPLSVVQLKGKHCRKLHCCNGVVD